MATHQTTNFAPRFGWAFDVFGDGKTALRGGYGWSFDDAEVSYYETTVFNNLRRWPRTPLDRPPLTPAAGGATTALSSSPGRVQGVPTTYKTPYVQQYSIDVQQEITPTLILDVGYFGDHGTHLLAGRTLTSPCRAPGWAKFSPPTRAAPASTPIPGHSPSSTPPVIASSTRYVRTWDIRPPTLCAPSQLQLQPRCRPRSPSVSAARPSSTPTIPGRVNLTNAQADYSGFVQNIYNVNADYGRAAVDRNNIISIDGVYEVPWYREQKGLTVI